MSESFQYVRESLMRELVVYRSMASVDTRRQVEPARDQELCLWLENTIFWIMQLQAQNEEENPAKYSEALNKARECLDRLQMLLG